MAFISQYQYYENGGLSPEDANWGSYQFVKLSDIVNNFILNYTGNNSIINNEPRDKIIHYAKEAVRELNFDAFKEIKVLELNVCDQLRFVLPSDYVNWVRVSMYKNGVLYPLEENKKAMSANAYLQDNDCRILFDQDGNALSPEYSEIDRDRITGQTPSIYSNPGSQFDGYMGYCDNGSWYFGGWFGLDTSNLSGNPRFEIDRKSGVLNFDSSMSGELVIMEYVTDGMEGGDETQITVNKLFEKYVYEYINYEILSNKRGVQEYVIARARKKSTAMLRNSKIRISDITPGKLLGTIKSLQSNMMN